MQLPELAADRRDADGVFEQSPGVAVVALGRRRQRAERGAESVVGEKPSYRRLQTRVRNLRGQKLEEAVQLVSVAAQCGGERGRVGSRSRLERAHFQLQAVAELLHPA